MFSNKYIFGYAAIMVIFVAAVLAGIAMVLQPTQEKNVKVEKIQDMLMSANIQSTPATAEKLYAEHIVREIVIDENGQEVSIYKDGNFEKGNIRAFDIDLASQLKIKRDAIQGKTNETPVYPIFEAEINGDTLYIIPLQGNGLWGPIWGNITFQSDFSTVKGVSFGHKGETPGLGAEISLPVFEDQFPGKEIMSENDEFTSISVIKGGVANSSIDPAHGVDAISGGTITSVGVHNMLRNNLSNYIAYFKNHKK